MAFPDPLLKKGLNSALKKKKADKIYAPILNSSMRALVTALGLTDNRPYEETAPPLGIHENPNSGYTGWGTPVGQRGKYNAILVPLASANEASQPSLLRLWVTENDYNGTLIADVTQPIVIPFGLGNNPTYVVVPLGKTVDTPVNQYVRHNTNGIVGVFRNNPQTTYPVGPYAQYGYTTNTIITSTAFTQPGGTTQGSSYYRFMMIPDVKTFTNGQITQAIISQNESAGTFTSYGSYGGAPDIEWNALDIGLGWYRIGNRANNIRVIARQGSLTGKIVGDVTIPISWDGIKQNRPLPKRVFFDQMIPKGAVYVQIIGDGYMTVTGLANATFPISPYGQSQYSTSQNLRNPTWQNSSTQWNPWLRFVKVDTSNGGSLEPYQITKALTEEISRRTGPRFNKVSNYYAVSGQEYSIYFDNIIISPDGKYAPDHYDFNVICSIGRQQKERFVIPSTPIAPEVTTPAAGTYPLTIEMFNNGILVDTLVTTINMAAADAGGGASRQENMIGDSLTAQGIIQAEQVKYSVDDANLDYAFVGNYTASNIKSSDGVNRTFNHSGNSGKTWNWWFTDPASPMVFSGAFNYGTFLANNGITLASTDQVSILLGINDVINATTDAAVYNSCGAIKTAADGMIASIRAAVPGIRIVIYLPTLPCYNQDAAGDDYASGIARYRARRNMQLLREYKTMIFDTAANRAANLYVVDMGSGWDNVNNIRLAAATPYNARATATVQRGNDLVHPGGFGTNENGGGFMCADVAWAFKKNRA